MSLHTPTSTLFPYTTLFRSDRGDAYGGRTRSALGGREGTRRSEAQCRDGLVRPDVACDPPALGDSRDLRRARCQGTRRSGEHTSELQSPCKLVCRLLL